MANNERLEKIMLGTLKGIIFLLPLFFLPLSPAVSGMDNFNKQYLLWLAAPLVFFLWAYGQFLKPDLKIKLSLLDLSVVLYLIASGMAAVFSVDSSASLFGGYGAAGQPLITTLCLAVFYVAIRSIDWSEQKIGAVFMAMVWSWMIVILFMLFQIFNLWSIAGAAAIIKYYVLAFGNLEELAVYLAVMAVLAYGYSRYYSFAKNWPDRTVKIFLALALIILAIINFSIAWWCFLSGLIAMLFLQHKFFPELKAPAALKRSGLSGYKSYLTSLKRDFWPLFLVLFAVIALAHYFMIDGELAKRRLAMNLQLDYGNSWQIAKTSIASKPIFGSGPDTYNYAFSQYRGAALNDSEYWNLRFIKSGTYLMEQISAIGLVGVAAYLALVVLFFIAIIKILPANRQNGRRKHLIIILPLAICLVLGQFLFAANILLLFLFWFLLGVMASAAADSGSKAVLIRKGHIHHNLLFALSVILLAGWIGLMILEGRYWLAEYYFNTDKTENGLIRAENFNPNRYNYQTALARLYSDQAGAAMRNNRADLAGAETALNTSIAWAKKAVQSGSRSVLAYETMGSVYRDISRYSPDSRSLAIAAFERAAALEPTNPVIRTEIGKLYLDAGLADQAREYFNQAIGLKGDYLIASFYIGKALARSGQSDEALAVFDSIAGKYNDQEVYYEMGQIAFNKKNYGAAIKYFSDVLAISPLYANAMYSLALAYEGAGDEQEALYYLKKTSGLDSGNADVKNKIKELETKQLTNSRP